MDREHTNGVDVHRAWFRQRFGIGVQWRRLGMELTQQQALAVLVDSGNLEAAYQGWLSQAQVRSGVR